MTNVLILGSEGRMGKWFYRYFKHLNKKQDQTVLLGDLLPVKKFFLVDTHYKGTDNFKNSKNTFTSINANDFLSESDIIVFCTPTKITLDILSSNITHFKPGSIILEISSLKEIVHKVLKAQLKKPNQPQVISIHPMFGPGASFVSEKNNIIYVPIKGIDRDHQLSVIHKLFSKFRILTIDSPVEHDTLISMIISLIYFINLIYAHVMLKVSKSLSSLANEVKLEDIKEFSGSSFKIQSLLTESIMTDDNSLFVSLLTDSSKTLKLIKTFNSASNEFADLLEKKDIEGLTSNISQIRNEIMNQVDIKRSYDLLYKFINKQNLNQ